MSDAQSAHRIRVTLILVFIGTIALGSFWLLDVMRKDTNSSTTIKQRNEPDFYVEKFNFTRMSTIGQAIYKVSGDKMTHLPADDSYHIVRPVIQNFVVDQPPTVAYANHASVEDKRKKIYLTGSVNIDRIASEKMENFHLMTDNLLLLPESNIMKTDQLVTITTGQAILTGTGMVANNATKQFKLLRHVRGTFPARAH